MIFLQDFNQNSMFHDEIHSLIDGIIRIIKIAQHGIDVTSFYEKFSNETTLQCCPSVKNLINE